MCSLTHAVNLIEKYKHDKGQGKHNRDNLCYNWSGLDRSQSGPLDKVGQLANRDIVSQGFHAQITIGSEENDFPHEKANFACWRGNELVRTELNGLVETHLSSPRRSFCLS